MPSSPAVWPGQPGPLGATWDGEGVNFALFSEHAEQIELCLFDPSGRRETARIPMRWQTDQVWHCYLPEARPGLLYGYRVHGPYDPKNGQRFNPKKLLLDPYARDIAGSVRWNDALFGYPIGDPLQDLLPDPRDSARHMPKSRVIDSSFTWGDDRPPRTPWHDTIIYELHVRGFTIHHPDVQPPYRGHYAGLASEPAIEHLKRLGVTAIELMPVHTFVSDRHLVEHGLNNYWGYNTIGYFAPHAGYSASGDINEFKTMVKRLHSNGIEVILDVVYNHSAEGNQLGPTLCFRGIDNRAYYRLVSDEPRYYMDYTGCGNSLNMMHPRVLQLIMDSLRYWITEMHVDGFRFDLAPTLAREEHAVDRYSAFLDIIHQDPLLSRVKLIAEPWDLGEGGYQVGNFPVGWAEWNNRYRDAMRAYWKGDGGQIGELAYRITGSSDLYAHTGRRPYASINFVTCHDGFTLEDLVSYNKKHNSENLEENRDGENHNLSWNCGVEGPTRNRIITRMRARQKRNFLTALLLSQGVPMLLAGDEMGRTQNGNNNAYCQDNAVCWLDWDLEPEDRELLDFVCRLIGLRKAHPVFRRRNFFQGRRIKGASVKDISWLRPDGEEMTDKEWSHSFARSLGLLLNGNAIEEQDERGRTIHDDSFVLLLNSHHKPITFHMPRDFGIARWEVVLDTSFGDGRRPDQRYYLTGESYPLEARSTALLRQARSR
ncbi:MAG: glycogen debranching protein GlgX [Gammaproteobacteria bacterium]|jgi:glycogen operon protein